MRLHVSINDRRILLEPGVHGHLHSGLRLSIDIRELSMNDRSALKLNRTNIASAVVDDELLCAKSFSGSIEIKPVPGVIIVTSNRPLASVTVSSLVVVGTGRARSWLGGAPLFAFIPGLLRFGHDFDPGQRPAVGRLDQAGNGFSSWTQLNGWQPPLSAIVGRAALREAACTVECRRLGNCNRRRIGFRQIVGYAWL